MVLFVFDNFIIGMRPQKRGTKLRSLIELPKQKDLHINPQFEFGIRHTLQPQSVQRKLNNQPFHCRTQESSPVRSKLEPINLTKSSHHLPNSKDHKVTGAKTVHFLDSLINILKEDKVVSMKLDGGGKRINTENMSANSNPIRKSNPKKPKILKNQMTKKFFEENCINRKIQSEDCFRKMKPKIDDSEQFTFYGNEKFKKDEMPFLENEFQQFVQKGE